MDSLTHYNDLFEITKSDTAAIPSGPPDAIYVGGAGVLQLVLSNGRIVPVTAVAGTILPFRKCVVRVNSTSTTASLMVALYSI